MVEPILASNYLYHYYHQLYRIGVTFASLESAGNTPFSTERETETERDRERETERERQRERQRAESGRLRFRKVPKSFVSNIGTNIVKA